MMNEKSKSLEKPGVKSGGAKKKISLMWLRWKNGIVFIFFSQQMSGTACKGLEGKCAGKMQNFMKKHKLLISSVQFLYDIIFPDSLLFSTDFSILPMNKM